MRKEEWVWMPHAGHLIVGRDCRFHLNTCVGKYIVSTVGEYLPDEPVRQIFADVRNITLEGKGDERLNDYMKKIGFMEVGLNRLYETMVFPAKDKLDKNLCCPCRVSDWAELDMQGYNDATEAYKGHLEMCEKWSEK